MVLIIISNVKVYGCIMTDEWVRSEPKTIRNKSLKWIWKVIPTLFLVLFIVVIGWLGLNIIDESNRLEAEKMAERRQEPPPVNIVIQKVVPETIHDRVNLPGIVEPWVRLELLSEIRRQGCGSSGERWRHG